MKIDMKMHFVADLRIERMAHIEASYDAINARIASLNLPLKADSLKFSVYTAFVAIADSPVTQKCSAIALLNTRAL